MIKRIDDNGAFHGARSIISKRRKTRFVMVDAPRHGEYMVSWMKQKYQEMGESDENFKYTAADRAKAMVRKKAMKAATYK